jgi:exosortase C (VPDSG-CTERM-specific)
MESVKDEVMVASAAARLGGAWAKWRNLPRSQRLRVGGCAGFVVLLTLLFIRPLTGLTLYAAGSNLDTYIVLIPFISAYLLYLQRGRPSTPYCTSIGGTVAVGGIGVVAVAVAIKWQSGLSINDGLTLMALAFVSFVAACGFLFFGSKWMASNAFPVAFLIFMVPLPDAAVNWLEQGSVLASADATAMFFDLTGTPVARESTVFELPGIVLKVAQECSGIHSSWVLFIASLLASHLFLRTRWRKAVLMAFAIPLGILRNGFRIAVIGLLCVHVGPHMIDSVIHRRGGPFFFALTLVPLFLLLWWLRRQEQRLSLPN